MTTSPAEFGRLADFVTIHPLFSAAPILAILALAWALARRTRRRSGF